MILLFNALLVCTMVGSTNADRMLRTIFNFGISPTAATFCDAADSLKIDNAFKPIDGVRYLREGTETGTNASIAFTDLEMADAHEDRELWPTYCRNNCAGYATGTCRATGCVGYRKKDRRQTQTLSCADHVKMLNNLLDDVRTQVSSTCAVFMNPLSRITLCYDDVIYGVVENFVLWKAPSKGKPLVSFGPVTDGFTICHNDIMSIEAVANPCVDIVTSTLMGPKISETRTSKEPPYTIFGVDKLIPTGRELNVVGTYTLAAVPDKFDFKKKSITFQVKKC
jgi:hypothetical protein